MPRRTFSLRLKTELADRLVLVASVQGRTQADVIRECLEKSLDVVVADESFQTALRERIEAQHALLTYGSLTDSSEKEM